MKIEIKGKRALFSRPELKVERYSYDVPTPSAILGILKSIYWKPEMDYVLKTITVINEPTFESIMTNALTQAASQETVISNLKQGFVKPTSDTSSPRNMTILTNVHYVVDFGIIATGTGTSEDDCAEKHQAIFARRTSKGQCFREPCLGVKEFTCEINLLHDDEDIPQSYIQGTIDLGVMLHHMDYTDSKPKAVFYHPIMRNGIIDVTENADTEHGWLFAELCNFYKNHQTAYQLPTQGYSTEKIHYEITLDDSGKMISFLPTITQDSKVSWITLQVPEMVKGRTSSIKANFCYDNESYVLGLDQKKGKEKQKAFLEKINEVIKEEIQEIELIKKFLASFDSEDYDHLFKPYYKNNVLNIKGNIVFRISGQDCYVHELPQVKEQWMNYYSQQNTNIGICTITGKKTSLTDMHAVIKGVINASSFTKLVSVNEAMTAYNSYGMQGLENSPMSNTVTFQYTAALSWLLNDKNHHLHIGDSTFVFWTESENQKLLLDIYHLLSGIPDEENISELIPNDEEFYIIELKANSARLYVKGFWKFVYGNSNQQIQIFCRTIQKRYTNTKLKQDWDYIAEWEKGENTMEHKSIGYLLGELFALLEKAQKNAVRSTNYTKTIADKYIEKASRMPSTVFPILLGKSIHHVNKVNYGMESRILEKQQEIDNAGGYPERLSANEQCQFYIGYGHKKTELYQEMVKRMQKAE